MLEVLLDWDRRALIFLNGLGSDTYDAFWSLATDIATWTPLFVLFFVLIMMQHRRREGLLISLTVLVVLLITHLLTDFSKDFFERLRPNNDQQIKDLLRVLKHPQGFSFFSGHASTSFAVTTLVFLFLRKNKGWLSLLFIWPLLFSFSRIYVGVHFPSDLLAGALVGTLLAFGAYWLCRRFIVPYSA
ncbi:phosphatase PAP2 family protein [Lentiprolixibacter aurantiacus]|uniref:Phosphatase PAP2 family protein n=1 Tax=Lentiprolixibacter aurantiacus TaxID=2993939 RepID=A0AAE3SNJ6_9FLAO|nr:phosphatase PAP2 family protein [Lentiprolixibacter aurantiacus]MCX2719251.1 phosphatase PAP2 family protein [Lentiprolixibacter aurantiacus]